MSQFFKKIPDSEKKSVRYEIRLSERDAAAIRAAAFLRNLSVADFIRRASLGRRADVGFDVEIVLTLHDVVQSIRRLHATFVALGMPIPKKELGTLVDHALAAMLRINK